MRHPEPSAGSEPVLRPLRFQGSRWAQRALRLLGWQIRFEGLPTLQGVIVVYPHTSNWDFVIGVLVKWSLGLPARFWGKDSLFRHPLLGPWMRSLGGVAVDRSAPQGIVGDTVRQIEAARKDGQLFWLALSPEGTRARTEGWRTGFYRLAMDAKVPVGLASLDYVRRVVTFTAFIELSGNRTRDMALIAERLVSAHGFHPQNAAPIRLL
jgi:1-acyl-sn-glycerol-3-phosphate acyltransferase